MPSYSIEPPVLSRIPVQYVESASHVLSFSLQKYKHLFRARHTLNTTHLPPIQVTYNSAYGVHTPNTIVTVDERPYLLQTYANVILVFVSVSKATRARPFARQATQILEVVIIFRYVHYTLIYVYSLHMPVFFLSAYRQDGSGKEI